MGIVSEWVLMFSKGLVLEVYIYLGTCTNNCLCPYLGFTPKRLFLVAYLGFCF